MVVSKLKLGVELLTIFVNAIRRLSSKNPPNLELLHTHLRIEII